MGDHGTDTSKSIARGLLKDKKEGRFTAKVQENRSYDKKMPNEKLLKLVKTNNFGMLQ